MKLFQLLRLLPVFLCYNFSAQVNYSDHVNPFIGTSGHGHTFPGAVLPFGMVQLSPDTRVDGSWDGSSGYHYSDKAIYGFSHTHLSGTGCSDWGDVLIMPTIGEPSLNNGIYSSPFDHKNEKASAGFYQVLLNDGKIKAELTVTPRVGIHRYTFPNSNQANIILDLLHRDKTLKCGITIIDSVTVSGYRVSQAWAKKQYVYFVMKFSKPFKNAELGSGKKFSSGLKTNQAEGAYFRFNTDSKTPLMVKVAISSTSIEGAMKNLKAEATHWDFETYKSDAKAAWNKQLQKIIVEDKDPAKMATFYTALYHASIHPSLAMDVDNKYLGRDFKVHTAEGFTNYSVFSLWDTHRALHPLFTVIEQKRTVDFINSFLNQYKQSGRLPMWELSGNETDCMIGFHAVSVIADAMAKGIDGFDKNLAYEAVKAAANYSAYGLPTFNKNGFLQVDDESESVSKTLEYGYDDWCVAQVAKMTGNVADAPLYLKRSQAYKNLFDVSTGNMRPRKNGGWLTPFYPSEINNHFTEGNSWQYSFYTPHDLEGLVKLHGGKDNFERKLDELFTTSEKNKGRDQADVTGLIGQSAHGNEPSHHMAYLYNFIGKPQKTIRRTQQICNDFYKNTPDGLIGNEDCGQMSAWYVFSAMGMYPVCPGNPQYVLSEPIFNSVTINLENGKSFLITSSASKKEVTGVSVNGETTQRSYLEHATLIAGGKLDFLYALAAGQKNTYGSQADAPRSGIVSGDLVPVPLIVASSQVFKDKVEVSIVPININGVNNVYTTDGTEPVHSSTRYAAPFTIDKNSVVKTKAFSLNDSSGTTTARFFRLKYNYDIQIRSKANAQYAADGAQTLIDGMTSDVDWRKGNWLGYQAQNFECIVDMKEKRSIGYLGIDCLQDTRSWIIFPIQVNFYSSDDNINFTLIGSVDNAVKADDYKVQSQSFGLQKNLTARYIKIEAKNFGRLPEWHEGKGGDAYIFVDELEIR